MREKCNLVAGVNGHIICAKSFIGCIRTCIHRGKDGEAFKTQQLARPPIYERRLDVTDAVHLPWEGKELDGDGKRNRE